MKQSSSPSHFRFYPCASAQIWHRRRSCCHAEQHQTPSLGILIMKQKNAADVGHSLLQRRKGCEAPPPHEPQDTRHRTQDTGHRRENADTGYRTPGTTSTRHRTRDTGHRTRDHKSPRTKHVKSPRNHEKSIVFKIKQDTQGDLQKHQESP